MCVSVVSCGGIVSQWVLHWGDAGIEAVWGFLLAGAFGSGLLLENAVLWGGGGSGQNQRGTGEGLVTALLVQLSGPFWMASNSSGGPEPMVA